MKTNAVTGIVLGAGAIFFALAPGQSCAEELIKVDQALKKIYREATAFDQQQITLSADDIQRIENEAGLTFGTTHRPVVILHTARAGADIVGHAFEDTVSGKWGPVHYLAGLDPQGRVAQVIILDYQEIRGRPAAKKRFLRQYKGKTAGDPVRLREDVSGISGATITSRSLTDGIRKLLYIFKIIQKTDNT